jgi:hypothetical protein
VRRHSYWFELCRRGIVRLSAWHSGRVINQLFTFSSTIQRLRQGPLSEHLDAYAAAVAEQGYAHHSIRQQIVVMEPTGTFAAAALRFLTAAEATGSLTAARTA